MLAALRGWRDLPREEMLGLFEAGHFAGMDELRANARLFDKVAPMGVNDIMMAATYRCVGGDCGWAGASVPTAWRMRPPALAAPRLAGLWLAPQPCGRPLTLPSRSAACPDTTAQV